MLFVHSRVDVLLKGSLQLLVVARVLPHDGSGGQCSGHLDVYAGAETESHLNELS